MEDHGVINHNSVCMFLQVEGVKMFGNPGFKIQQAAYVYKYLLMNAKQLRI